jgi:putative SOS response-associated peptidase YedK
MCYSAKVVARWREFCRASSIRIDLEEFHRLYTLRQHDGLAARLPRGFDLEFSSPEAELERQIQAAIAAWRTQRMAELERELFAQRRRLAEAERRLAAGPTKSAQESRRIASNRIQQALSKLTLLRGDQPHPDDCRIFPMGYAPILVRRGGELLLTPARYQIRPRGKPAGIDRQLTLFNARRDRLTAEWWRPLFGTSHAILPAVSFFENVAGPDGRNRVLEFIPANGRTLWIACLYVEWGDPRDPASRLQSFASITDEPTPEVAATGHDRVPVNLTWEAALRWLDPSGLGEAELMSLLDQRQGTRYVCREAA